MRRLLVIDYVGAETGVRTFLQSLLPALADAARARSWDISLVLPAIDYHGREVRWATDLASDVVHVALHGDASHREPQRFRAWSRDAVTAEDGAVAYFPFPYLSSCPELGLPIVATFHDFNHKRFSTWGRETRQSLEEQLPTWIHAATPVVSSRFIANELASYHPEAESRVTVVPLGVPAWPEVHDASRWTSFCDARGIAKQFILTVGWLSPHKNQAILFEALARLPREQRPMLVLVGPNSASLAPDRVATEAYARHLRHLARARNLEYGVDYIGTGHVSNPELAMLYAHATGLVMPTLYEAGSFPVREAVYAGCPVACSRVPPVVEDIERMHDDAALIFDPFDPDDVAAAITRLPEQRLVTRERHAELRARAMAAFDWNRTAAGYWDVFESAQAAAA